MHHTSAMACLPRIEMMGSWLVRVKTAIVAGFFFFLQLERLFTTFSETRCAAGSQQPPRDTRPRKNSERTG